MKMDATKACTTCQNCGQPSNWTYDDGGCPLCGKPRGTPPIAAPAAHIERRKGQRWRYHNARAGLTIEGIFLHRLDSDNGWLVDTGQHIYDDAWPHGFMTLLADAPPEPAKSTTPQCESFCRPGLRCKYCTTEAVGPSLPAQEAPKAAPVCCVEGQEIACGGSLLRRIIGHDIPPILICDAHWMLRESRMIEGAKAPYAGPERLPRPQLAADWVEDCLPESGR